MGFSIIIPCITKERIIMKINIIKKVLLLDSKVELEKVYSFVNEAICRELDKDDKEQVEFKKWKEMKAKEREDADEIPF
tara:strand:- start:91 stop:327 length:237 start_codon:yes stop_codon:yes gene_type:complete